MSSPSKSLIKDLDSVKEPTYLELEDIFTEMLPLHTARKKTENKADTNKKAVSLPPPPPQKTRTIKPKTGKA